MEMTRTAEWHREYLRLENAAAAASAELRAAGRALGYKRVPAGAQARYDAALEAARETGRARWEFEMAATVIVDIATLPAAEWAAALR
jgi:hypothetical protein